MAANERAASNAAHLLVVEDDVEVASVLRRYFEGQGFRVSTASNGDAMRAALGGDPVRLVLLHLGPRGPARVLGLLFGRAYAAWCARRMTTDAVSATAGVVT